MALGDVERSYTINLIGQDKASAAFRKVDSSASRTQKIMAGLTKAMKAAALAAGVALAAAAALAAKYLWDAVKAAYADDNAMKALARTQRKAQDATEAQTKATSKLIDKLELQSTFADDELRPAMAALALTGMSVKKSHDLLTLSMDVAAAKGKSVQSVAEALAKAYNGNTAGLGRMGVATKDAEGNALSLSEILETLKKRTEGAAKAAARRDPWTVLGHAMEQVKEKIGTSLLPMFRKLARWLIDHFVPWVKHTFVPAMRRFSRWIQDEAVPWIRNKLVPAIRDELVPRLKDWWGKIKDIGGVLKTLWEEHLKETVDKIKELGMSIGGDDGAANGVDGLADSFQDLADVLGPVLDTLSYIIDKLTWINDNVGGILSKVGDALNPVTGIKRVFDNPFNNADGGWLRGRASGGWTVVGEHGPELISPHGFVSPHSRTMGGNGGGIVVNIHGVVDKVGAAREVQKVLLELKRSTGGTALGIA